LYVREVEDIATGRDRHDVINFIRFHKLAFALTHDAEGILE
jgi:hypothetical protein